MKLQVNFFKKSCVAFSIFLASIALSSATFSEGMQKESGEINKGKPAKLDVLTALAFVEASFPSALWVFDFSPAKLQVEPDRIKSQMPFVAEYILREYGWPEIDVINKWETRDITVGYGWPVKAMSPSSEIAIKKDLIFLSLLEPIITRKIDEINKLGVVTLRFVAPDKEERESSAKIRITGFKWSESKSVRFGSSIVGWGAASRSWYFEPLLRAGVRFSPEKPWQVEGFLLPKADNTIGAAACYINVDYPPEMLDSYVEECIFRSLGLPSVASRTGILQERKDSKDAIHMTEKDIDILHLLYDERIKPGDSKRSVIKKLNKF